MPEGMSIYERPEEPQGDDIDGLSNPGPSGAPLPDSPLEQASADKQGVERASSTRVPDIRLAGAAPEDGDGYSPTPCSLEVPITYRTDVIGVLLIEDDTAFRNWEDEEVLMVKTVSDQLSVAIKIGRASCRERVL